MAPRKRKAEDDGGGATKAQKARKAAPNGVSTRITRNMTTDGPRKAVFNTAELLENIFLHVPPKTVIAAQRVCHQFQDIVTTSARLQQRTFLRPSTTPKESWLLQESPDRFWDPELAFFTTYPLPALSNFTHAETVVPVKLHPSLSLCYSDGFYGISAARLSTVGGERVLFSFKNPSASSASWRDAYVTDPPCQKAEITLHWQIKAKPVFSGAVIREVSSPTGLKLGDLFDAALHARGKIGYWTGGKTWTEDLHTALVDILAELEQRSGKKTAFNTRASQLHLSGVVVPTEEEWERMRERRDSRDPVEKPGARDGMA